MGEQFTMGKVRRYSKLQFGFIKFINDEGAQIITGSCDNFVTNPWLYSGITFLLLDPEQQSMVENHLSQLISLELHDLFNILNRVSNAIFSSSCCHPYLFVELIHKLYSNTKYK